MSADVQAVAKPVVPSVQPAQAPATPPVAGAAADKAAAPAQSIFTKMGEQWTSFVGSSIPTYLSTFGALGMIAYDLRVAFTSEKDTTQAAATRAFVIAACAGNAMRLATAGIKDLTRCTRGLAILGVVTLALAPSIVVHTQKAAAAQKSANSIR